VSVAYTVLGLALLAAGAIAMVLGAWTITTNRRPPWLHLRTLPVGRERGWGTAMVMEGGGSAVLGVSEMQGAAVSALRLLGIGLLVGGVLVLAVAVRQRPSQ